MYSFSELTAQDVQIVLSGLGELPLKLAAPTFNKLQAQLQNQAQPLPPQTEVEQNDPVS